MKKFFSGFLVLCLSLALLTACGTGGQTGKTVTAGGLTFAKSYSEVYSALTDAQKAIADRDKSLNMSDGTSGDPEAGGKGDGEGTFYSGTNVQVAGVDEGDIVKTDGTYIYILRGSELIVMQADGADVTDVSNVFVGQDWEQTTTGRTRRKSCRWSCISQMAVRSFSRRIPTGRAATLPRMSFPAAAITTSRSIFMTFPIRRPRRWSSRSDRTATRSTRA